MSVFSVVCELSLGVERLPHTLLTLFPKSFLFFSRRKGLRIVFSLSFACGRIVGGVRMGRGCELYLSPLLSQHRYTS